MTQDQVFQFISKIIQNCPSNFEAHLELRQLLSILEKSTGDQNILNLVKQAIYGCENDIHEMQRAVNDTVDKVLDSEILRDAVSRAEMNRLHGRC